MPQSLCIDELGYLPIDKFGADCLFQIIGHRYERGATLMTTNHIYKHWANIFDKDAVLTSALLDRLLHHAETVLIEGKSYRSRDQIEIWRAATSTCQAPAHTPQASGSDPVNNFKAPNLRQLRAAAHNVPTPSVVPGPAGPGA